jgi:hypothetical protein
MDYIREFVASKDGAALMKAFVKLPAEVRRCGTLKQHLGYLGMGKQHGIVEDEKGQDQPADKARAQTSSLTSPVDDKKPVRDPKAGVSDSTQRAKPQGEPTK